MNNKNKFRFGFGPGSSYKNNPEYELFMSEFDEYKPFERVVGSYDLLRDYSEVYNMYRASTPQPNPFSNKAMFIIDTLTKMGVKYTIDIFTYDNGKVMWGVNDDSCHKLVNIIAEPNPEASGAAIVFVAHHDVANIRSQNAQDNGASVCNLLRLASLIKKSGVDSQRTILLFSDCEENSAKGANQFAKSSSKDVDNSSIRNHDTYGKISSVVNLELTGKGTVVWSDCEKSYFETQLHERLEKTLGRTIPKLDTPPNDAIAFRKYGYPVLCIGILPENDMKDKDTWKVCHSLRDNIEGCDRKNMEDFTTFLFNLTKLTTNDNGANETEGAVRT